MARSNHLVLTEFSVGGGEEWQANAEAWLLIRVASGVGYWRDLEPAYREMLAEDVLLIFPGASGAFLASRIGDVQLQTIAIDLGLLYGVLTVPECRALAAYAAKNEQKSMFLPKAHPFAVRFSEICRLQRGNALVSRLRLLQLFAELIEDELQQAADVEPVLSDSRARMRHLVQQIPEAVLMRCSVSELSEKLFCSQRHFSRLFREEFGVSLREKQTKLRLERARHLLESGSDKIIDIALDAGYQSLSLFNVMFKERFKMTPSQWRARIQANKVARRRPSGSRGIAPAVVTLLVFMAALVSRLFAAESARQINSASTPPAPTPTGSASTSAGTRLSVTGYEVAGNTLLSAEIIQQVLSPHTGPEVDLSTIRKARADLLLAYRDRGFATVAVLLPQQRITNGLVYLQVSEGHLAEIVVVNNRYFTSNNVMRALPSLSTGAVLNSKFLQAELDQANANRDRQIYPQIAPGPSAGTSSLLLKVKDRLPLHGRVELNNYHTPETPTTRLNSSIQYNNLWQLEHSVGIQYGFTPDRFKDPGPGRPGSPLDQPQIAFYNAFYRLPLGAPRSVEEAAASRPSQFGYNEATRQFSVPPASLVPELYVFGNRSTTDSAIRKSVESLVASNAVTTIRSWTEDLDYSVTESVGARLNWPVVMRSLRGGLSFGADLRHYESLSYHTNVFSTTSIIPPANPNDPPDINTALTISGREGRGHSLTYLPLVFRAEAGMPDRLGFSSASLGATYNLPLSALSDASEFANLSGSPASASGFAVFTGSLAREQKIGGDWQLLARADGQVASGPLFSNEQYTLGGISSVRGYLQGESFGDYGYRLSLEPRTPALPVTKLGSAAVLVRFSSFLDYGRTYLMDPRGREQNSSLVGFGAGMNWTIGRTFDMTAVVAWPKRSTRFSDYNGAARFYFSAAAQF